MQFVIYDKATGKPRELRSLTPCGSSADAVAHIYGSDGLPPDVAIMTTDGIATFDELAGKIVTDGALVDDPAYVAPIPPTPTELAAINRSNRTTAPMSLVDFRKLFTLAERAKIDTWPTLSAIQSDVAAMLKTGLTDLAQQDGQIILAQQADLIDVMVSAGLITSSRATRIKDGLPPV